MLVLHPAAPACVLAEPGDNEPGAPHTTDTDPDIRVARLAPAVTPDLPAGRSGIARKRGHRPTIELIFEPSQDSGAGLVGLLGDYFPAQSLLHERQRLLVRIAGRLDLVFG
jgi:hypothetical protein